MDGALVASIVVLVVLVGAAITVVALRGRFSGDAELEGIIDKVIEQNPKSAADFKAGKQQALMFLVGQAMKLTKGRANPERLNALLREKIL